MAQKKAKYYYPHCCHGEKVDAPPHRTSQQDLQPLLLAHRGGNCPQSHLPARTASSMHIFCMAEDIELCAEVGSGAAWEQRRELAAGGWLGKTS